MFAVRSLRVCPRLVRQFIANQPDTYKSSSFFLSFPASHSGRHITSGSTNHRRFTNSDATKRPTGQPLPPEVFEQTVTVPPAVIDYLAAGNFTYVFATALHFSSQPRDNARRRRNHRAFVARVGFVTTVRLGLIRLVQDGAFRAHTDGRQQ